MPSNDHDGDKHDGDEQDDDDDGCHPMRIYTSAQPQSLSFKLGSIFAEMGILITTMVARWVGGWHIHKHSNDTRFIKVASLHYSTSNILQYLYCTH